ncbi:hypothetical protein ABZ468_45815 [Streptomyces sp. NPDC005708]|uniref:hypothetical protein n=1 Tax=Streptomyces sp. NPDC005708 TaxID=3154564 RepID=UPI0033C8DAD2
MRESTAGWWSRFPDQRISSVPLVGELVELVGGEPEVEGGRGKGGERPDDHRAEEQPGTRVPAHPFRGKSAAAQGRIWHVAYFTWSAAVPVWVRVAGVRAARQLWEP